MKNLINFARQQRKNKNPWEYKLWQYLRAHRFLGFQFKRQVPIDEFIVDFCCRSKKLIIELDGSQHQFSEKDKIRDKKLELLGYTILRFWNNDLDNNLGGILEKIVQTINPSPDPSPKKERGV